MMVLKSWESLPKNLKNEKTLIYYKILSKKRESILLKRMFDFVISFVISLFILPFFLLFFLIIKLTSPGPAIFKQKRVTTYGKNFNIFKFRTMVQNSESIGPAVTAEGDPRITKIGKFLRKYRLDELPQIFNILFGHISFVGARPESVKYVEMYSDEMKATLFLPAGVTSLASILYKDEEKILKDAKNIDETYMNEILPKKMKYNLEYLKNFNFWYDIKVMIKTVFAVLK